MTGKEDMLSNQEIIDVEAFGQLIELDEEDDSGFLKSVVEEWYNQADETFAKMDDEVAEKDLLAFSRLAHFLKGSSGQIGVLKVRDTCSTLQHLGELWDEDKSKEKKANMSDAEALKRIKPLLARVKIEYAEAEKWLKKYLSDEPEADTDELETPKAEIPEPKRTSIDSKSSKSAANGKK